MRPLALITAALLVPQVLLAQADDAAARAAASITPNDIITRIGVLADDSMRGRNTPSPELDEVAQWIGSEFEKFGLRPGGDDGSFVQRYPLRVSQSDADASGVENGLGTTLHFGRDAALLAGATGKNGVVAPTVLMTGAPTGEGELQTEALAGANVLWVMPTSPGPGLNETLQQLFAANTASILMVTPRPDEAWQQLLHRPTDTSMQPGWEESSDPLIVEMREAGAAALLADPALDLSVMRNEAFAIRKLDSVKLRVIATSRTLDQASAPNVVGILDGSDPQLKDQYVVFSAHMDHVGVGNPVNGDSIYNGADDDASGTATVMELAQAFAMMQPRPRRSMIFLTVSGEEKGLWGSDYFSRHPPVPIEQIVADLNADMVGRNWRDTIVAIGKEHSNLGTTLAEVNAEHPELHMTAIDDIWPDEQFYFRSDHYNFARRGVPILFFFNGTHPQYHQPSDEVDLIDSEKASRIGRLIFYLGLEIAQRDDRPRWNPESYRQIVEGAAGHN